MATVSITIPDASLARVVDALCKSGFWSADTGLTRNEFARQEVARMIRQRVIETERQTLLADAAAAAASLGEPPIT